MYFIYPELVVWDYNIFYFSQKLMELIKNKNEL